MSITRKIAAVASAAALATTCFATASAGVAQAAPGTAFYTVCSLRHAANYPPGKCFLRFSKGTYHRHDMVRFVSARDFRPGENLTVTLSCRKGYKHHRKLVHGWSYHHVGARGHARGHLHLTHKTPYGTCTVTVRGKTSHSVVRGSFRVKKKHVKH